MIYWSIHFSTDLNLRSLLFVRLLSPAFYRCSHVNIIILLTFHQASCRVDIFSFSRLLSGFTLPGPPLPRTVGCLKNSCKNKISRKLLSTFVSSSQDWHNIFLLNDNKIFYVGRRFCIVTFFIFSSSKKCKCELLLRMFAHKIKEGR